MEPLTPAEFASTWGLPIESWPYLDAVAAWRRAWKPRDDDVRVVLLAESHVAESPGDAEARVLPPTGGGLGSRWPVGLPDQYVRLVYCLGYGEPKLCHPAVPRNVGTRQYWNLFAAIAHGSMDIVQPGRNGNEPLELFHARVAWKLDVLKRLRDKGVWLIDVSPVALYVPGGKRLAEGAKYDALIRDAFRHFVQPQLIRFGGLEQVWIIGHGMAHALLGSASDQAASTDVPVRARLDPARVVAQPQGDRAVPGRHRRELARLVSALRDRASPEAASSIGAQQLEDQRPEPARLPPEGPEPLAPLAPRSHCGAVRVTYRFSRLCFRRDVIEPLDDDDVFEVVTPNGVFQMTKREFYADFANVTATASYRDRGVYHYALTPQRGLKYKVST